MDDGSGLFFPRCNDIHMWLMRIPIDVVFLRRATSEVTGDGADPSERWEITSVHEDVRPWRPLPLRDGRASETLELPAGTIRRHAIRTGDELCLS